MDKFASVIMRLVQFKFGHSDDFKNKAIPDANCNYTSQKCAIYRKTSSIRRTKSQNLNAIHLIS